MVPACQDIWKSGFCHPNSSATPSSSGSFQPLISPLGESALQLLLPCWINAVRSICSAPAWLPPVYCKSTCFLRYSSKSMAFTETCWSQQSDVIHLRLLLPKDEFLVHDVDRVRVDLNSNYLLSCLFSEIVGLLKTNKQKTDFFIFSIP